MKNIYDMLNDIEVDLSEYEKEDFNDIEKKKIKNNFRKSIKKNKRNNNNKKYITAASVVLISLGIVSTTKLGTYAYEKLEDIAYNIKTTLGIEEDLGKYTNDVSQSITKRGLTVKINEVLLDGNELLISIAQTYGKELKKDEHIDLISQNLYINGKRINKGARSYHKTDNPNKEEYVIAYDLGSNEFKGDINVKLRIMDAYVWKDKNNSQFNRINGPWTFKFKVNGDDLVKNTNNITVNKKIKLDTGATLYIDNYTGNIVNQRMDVRYTKHTKPIEVDDNIKINAEYGNIVFNGKDDLGNKVKFSPARGKIGQLESNYLYELYNDDKLFDKNAKSLTLTPYLEVSVEKDGSYKTYYKKIGETFNIDLNNK